MARPKGTTRFGEPTKRIRLPAQIVAFIEEALEKGVRIPIGKTAGDKPLWVLMTKDKKEIDDDKR
jgi:hypothetical protein